MNALSEDLPLAREFPAATRDDWHKLVDASRKGAQFEKKLVSRSHDGLRIEPLYPRKVQAQPVTGRSPGRPWQVAARVDHPDPVEANRQALRDLENGATALSLVFAGSTGAYGYGLAASEAVLVKVLDGVFLDAGVAFEFDLSAETKDAPAHFASLIAKKGVDARSMQVRFGFDPIGAMARGGGSPVPWSGITFLLNDAVRPLVGAGFTGPFIAADARVVHAAGGSEAQELAYALACAAAYLRALEAGGFAPDAARRMISFRLAADADQFFTMAKFRSLRKLWARVEEACGLPPEPVFISAETAWRMMSRRDVYVNMLRTTIAAFGAGLGGADSISMLPHTSALGLPDAFARRVSRNAQLILLEESNLTKVADPAAGSGGIEALTDELCETAWTLFREIEKAGGIVTALADGSFQARVGKIRDGRATNIARRKEPLTGTSEFPHLAEAPGSVLDVPRVEVAGYSELALTFPPLAPLRLAEPFEALRDASDRHLQENGARPKIFLANLGTPADFTARATFAKNFFEAGGIEAVPDDATAAGDIGAAFARSGAALACICSSDDVYAHEAQAVARALGSARHIYLAGRPGELEAPLRAAGVATFIYAGSDALATLRNAHDILGLK